MPITALVAVHVAVLVEVPINMLVMLIVEVPVGASIEVTMTELVVILI